MPIGILLLNLVEVLFWIYMIMLFIRILGSWFPEYRSSAPMVFVSYYTDPYLDLFRRLIPPLGMIDFSPILAFFSLQFIEMFVKLVIRGLFL